MTRNFRLALLASRGTKFWLQVVVGLLGLLNLVVILLLISPPGGTLKQLTMEQDRLRTETANVHTRAVRLRTVAAAVQTGSGESTDFQTQYFLPRRLAYAAVIEGIQQMASASGLRERDAVYAEEPIEGTADLSVMNSTANYEGAYDNLLRFLREVDRSPMLLMLDNLQAAPQQKGGVISTSIRFQTVIRDDGTQRIGVDQ